MLVTVKVTADFSFYEDDNCDFIDSLGITVVGILLTNHQNYTVGHGYAYRLRMEEARSSGINPFHVLDELTMAKADTAEALLNRRTGLLLPKVLQLLPNLNPGDLVVLDRIVINPPFRCHGIGLGTINILTRKLLPGSGLFTIKPYPLQYEGKGPFTDDENAALEKARHKLRAHYSRVGFLAVPRSHHMVLAAQTRKPFLYELGLDRILLPVTSDMNEFLRKQETESAAQQPPIAPCRQRIDSDPPGR